MGVVGEDETGEALLRYFEEKGVSTRHVGTLGGLSDPNQIAHSRRA